VWALAQLPVFVYASATLVCIVAGIVICGAASKSLDSHDHPGIVWDEIAGMMLTMLFIPFSWLSLGLGFLLFRVFDILKPWPIRLIDRKVGGGLGIMLDDILAAVFANILLRILLQVLP
jgi:phosphatidylglycerophosphatase A